MKIRDFMINDVISVTPSSTLKEVLTLMVEHQIGGLPVVNENNELAGMISDGDIIRYLSPKEESVHDLFYTVYVEEAETEKEVLEKKINSTAADVMSTKNIYTLNDDEEFETAIRIFSNHHFKKLPVLDKENRVIGVISRGDIIYNLSKMILKK